MYSAQTTEQGGAALSNLCIVHCADIRPAVIHCFIRNTFTLGSVSNFSPTACAAVLQIAAAPTSTLATAIVVFYVLSVTYFATMQLISLVIHLLTIILPGKEGVR